MAMVGYSVQRAIQIGRAELERREKVRKARIEEIKSGHDKP